MVNELPCVRRAEYESIRIAPDMKVCGYGQQEDYVIKAVSTTELEEILEGLQYYANRLHHLKLCVQNADTFQKGENLARSELSVLKFPEKSKKPEIVLDSLLI